jgi:hypothetical protein
MILLGPKLNDNIINFMGGSEQFLNKFEQLTKIGYWKNSYNITKPMLDYYTKPIIFNNMHPISSIFGGGNSLIKLDKDLFIVISSEFTSSMADIMRGLKKDNFIKHLRECEINRLYTSRYINQNDRDKYTTVDCPICGHSNAYNYNNIDLNDICFDCRTTYNIVGNYYRYDELISSMINSGEYCFITNNESDELYLITIGDYLEFDSTMDWMKQNKTNRSIDDMISIVDKYLNCLVNEYIEDPNR